MLGFSPHDSIRWPLARGPEYDCATILPVMDRIVAQSITHDRSVSV